MQDTKDSFLDRLENVRAALGGSMVKVASFTGISRPLIYAMRAGHVPISEESLAKLSNAERRLKTPDETGREDGSPPPPPLMQLNPAYATPPAAPTRAQIEARVKAYLDAAERVPGGLGYAWGQVATHLNPQSLDALKIET